MPSMHLFSQLSVPCLGTIDYENRDGVMARVYPFVFYTFDLVLKRYVDSPNATQTMQDMEEIVDSPPASNVTSEKTRERIRLKLKRCSELLVCEQLQVQRLTDAQSHLAPGASTASELVPVWIVFHQASPTNPKTPETEIDELEQRTRMRNSENTEFRLTRGRVPNVRIVDTYYNAIKLEPKVGSALCLI